MNHKPNALFLIEFKTHCMKTIITILLLFFAGNIQAQELKADVKDLSFMSGTWGQVHEWGDMEETWSKPMGNCMVSTFRCLKDGKVVFYEFVVIEQEGNTPVLKMRHFNPGSIGWEDKNTPLEFSLIELSKNKAVFEVKDKSLKMTYTVTPKSKMDIVLEEKNKDGVMQKTQFNFKYK